MPITCIIVIILLFIIVVNLYEIFSSKNQILEDENTKIENIDCLLVLGAGIINNERPTLMLKDRLDKSIELYKKGLAPKIIMSGDHSSIDHNEVIIMKKYAEYHGSLLLTVLMFLADFISGLIAYLYNLKYLLFDILIASPLI